jgi:hypothetical protein
MKLKFIKKKEMTKQIKISENEAKEILSMLFVGSVSFASKDNKNKCKRLYKILRKKL